MAGVNGMTGDRNEQMEPREDSKKRVEGGGAVLTADRRRVSRWVCAALERQLVENRRSYPA